MGTFSIAQWLIIFFFLAAHEVPIILAKKDDKLARLQYFLRVLIWVAVGAVLIWQLKIRSNGSEIAHSSATYPVIFATIAVWGISVLWAVHRTQDIGWPKWWCLLMLAPAANLIFLLALLLWPGRTIEEQERRAETLAAQSQSVRTNIVVAWGIFCVCVVIGVLVGLLGTTYGLMGAAMGGGWGNAPGLIIGSWIIGAFIGLTGWGIKSALTTPDRD